MKQDDGRQSQPTLADVARAVGVSPITVSRAISRPEMVSESLRAEIARAVQRLGYTPNPAASALASGRSRIIGLILPSLSNNVFSEVVRGIYDGLERTPFASQIGNSRYSPLEEERLLATFRSQRPSGLIIAGIDQTAAAARTLRSMNCAVVQVMDLTADPVDAIVGLSHFDAGHAAGRHLVAAGYARPGFLGARGDPRTQKRAAGFRAAVQAAGRHDPAREVMVPDASSIRLGGHMMAELLSRAPDTDAVFCNNDDLAAGALFECQRRRIDVPDRMGICGFNDLEICAATHPALTSIYTPRYEMGRRAVDHILARLDSGGTLPLVQDCGFDLRARASTARRQGRAVG